jgi:DNA polymerase-3 subunit epsilon
MREIVLDTETTGLDPGAGHRIAEIGCLELVDHVPTGRTFQRYVNPERDMPADAFAVHGLTREFLARHLVFAEVAPEFLDFIADSPLVIHNAEFDLGFLNAELARAGFAPLPLSRAIDTVSLARRKHPGAQANLDALCRRFGIDNSGRTLHGALRDAELLAGVYLELIGGRQADLRLGHGQQAEAGAAAAGTPIRAARPHAPSAEELAAHREFLARIKDPIWNA